MVRQARTYLVGAVSGATLIVIAIAVFVLLVSAQVFRNWPIAALGDSGGGSAGVSDARAASGDSGAAAPTSSARAAQTTAPRAPSRAHSSAPTGGAGVNPDPVSVDAAATPPSSRGGSGQDGRGSGGGGNNPTTTPSPSPGTTSTSPSPGSSRSNSGTSGSSGSTAATTPTGKVAETVDNTVGAVDETVTGGTLEKTGVTKVTEGVVNGVLGSESPVGKVADETVGAVGGLLNPGH
jgi:hypothetical protein